MVSSRYGIDGLRAAAIASQALGFILIMTLETCLGDAARPWQGMTLALMLLAACWVALMRRYRHNKQRRAMAERVKRAKEDDE
ncbi:hypothetical protein SAMN05421509_11131 [Chromohalobacter canadensis]|uniref:Uncharacterized protein n=1 Tax=Chromohalobacter canadensis TaxID=141389 RepID=A0A285VV00_9GAMM|nr:hypothetical protein [Chromohalobacter canadensis]SOC57855.1 hypothetical protein SAMN05421509_11131 [Chromohalobacter canadensis]